jgi:glycosyltransferase involved in cell wall biosynthesis
MPEQPELLFGKHSISLRRLKSRHLASLDFLARTALNIHEGFGLHYRRAEAQACGLIPGLVSVILPVYNQATFLAESIDSVLGQTYSSVQLIIVNDGSTDGTQEMLSRYEERHHLTIITTNNQGLPRALSTGFSYASGEFWTWTSADNIMEPSMLSVLVKALADRPALGMIYADYSLINEDGSAFRDREWRAHNRPDPESGTVRPPRTTATLSVYPDNFIGPCFVYRGAIGRQLGAYTGRMGIEDYDYWLRLISLAPIGHTDLDDCLYKYRIHENMLSSRPVSLDIHRNTLALLKKYS